MLRVTRIEEGSRTVLIVEGKLTSATKQPLVDLMRGLSVGEGGTQSIVVDLMGVTSIDLDGQQLLKELHLRGASLRAKGCLNRAIVDGITCCAPESAGADAPSGQQATKNEGEKSHDHRTSRTTNSR